MTIAATYSMRDAVYVLAACCLILGGLGLAALVLTRDDQR